MRSKPQSPTNFLFKPQRWLALSIGDSYQQGELPAFAVANKLSWLKLMLREFIKLVGIVGFLNEDLLNDIKEIAKEVDKKPSQLTRLLWIDYFKKKRDAEWKKDVAGW